MVAYKIVITPEARKSIKSIFDYYDKFISKQMAKNINDGIRKDINILASQPNIGKSEIINGRELKVLVSVNYKIYYIVEEKVLQVIIIEIFDSRQHPDKLQS